MKLENGIYYTITSGKFVGVTALAEPLLCGEKPVFLVSRAFSNDGKIDADATLTHLREATPEELDAVAFENEAKAQAIRLLAKQKREEQKNPPIEFKRIGRPLTGHDLIKKMQDDERKKSKTIISWH